jgi:hypothetical protein
MIFYIIFCPILALSAFFLYGVIASHSFAGYLQNYSLLPIYWRFIYFFFLCSLCLAVEITLLLLLKKRADFSLKKKIGKAAVILLLLFALNILLDSYFILKLYSIFDSPNLAYRAILTRYNHHSYLKNLISPTEKLSNNKYGSSDNTFFLLSNKNMSKWNVCSSDNSYTYTMEHWVISPGEVFWILPGKYTSNHYILYHYAYDQDDMNKVFISNISTGKTALLSKSFKL